MLYVTCDNIEGGKCTLFAASPKLTNSVWTCADSECIDLTLEFATRLLDRKIEPGDCFKILKLSSKLILFNGIIN